MNEEHDLIKEVKGVAIAVHRKWPNITSVEDLEQDIWEFILERPSTYRKIQDSSLVDRRRILTKTANQIAKESYRKLLLFDGNYEYSVGDIKTILETGDLVGNQDVAAGFEQLPERYAQLITDRYVHLNPPKAQADRTALSRALTRLTDYANRHRDSEYSELTPGNTLDDGPGTKSSQLTRETGY